MAHNPDCVFCKIVAEELPSYRIYEDQDFLAFLDIFPTHVGQMSVIPKEHHTSDPARVNPEVFAQLTNVAQRVAQQIQTKDPEIARCIFVIEGLELDHLHIKIFPARKPNPVEYVVTHSGEAADHDKLKQLHELLKSD